MDSRTFYPYLDNFDELTIIIPLKNYRETVSFKLVGNDEVIDLDIIQKIDLGEEVKLVCSFDAYIDLGKIYCVENDEMEQSELYTGKIVRTDLFDNVYNYKKNDLGYTYTKKSTKFKIWTPVAKYVKLELVRLQEKPEILDMLYTNSGVWRLLIEEDLDGALYRYHVYVNGKEQVVTDPYAIASSPASEYSVVIDLKKTYQMKHNPPFKGEIQDAIIYEMSVRDFTIDPEMKFQHKGKFIGLIEKGIKTPAGHPAGLDYFKSLGVTHVQLMPIFDFDGVDELNPGKSYNWGYNPRQYNVPQGWFSVHPNEPYSRINELKQTIDTLHANNISVVMDVVYNHVFDPVNYPFEKLVPGYAYHVDREGIYTNVSGCRNDLATHRKMIRKLIIDSVLYWVNEYKIDGFRFDLMGLIDFETMNELRQELHAISNHIIVFGEGWKMYSSNMADRMAHMGNKKVLHTIGFFNDTFRETIKGATFDLKIKGYATGNIKKTDVVKEMLLGSAANRYLFKYASQSINYVECHDNNTFFDKCLALTKDIDLIHKQQKLATSMVLLSEGVPFLHSGQECYRTKKGVENSFESGDDINAFDWGLVDLYQEDINYIKKLIEFRKNHEGFKMKSSSDLLQFAEVLTLASKSMMFHLNNKENIIIVFKPLKVEETIVVGEGYRLALSSEPADASLDHSSYVLKEIGTYIFIQGSENA
ncbi:MAG: type I pullulanase [Firmicutes bacterium]|nr:type I pullulanase [Bacillota bacterium]